MPSEMFTILVQETKTTIAKKQKQCLLTLKEVIYILLANKIEQSREKKIKFINEPS